VDSKYGERYRDLFERHWWWRARTEFVVATLRRLQPPQKWSNILDIGCGDGLFFERLAEFGEVEGIEPSAEFVRPNNPHRSRIHLCPLDETFRPGKQYSLILMLDVLEHLKDPVSALRHVMTLLAPAGTFVATVPAFMLLWTSHDVLNHHYIRYTKTTFRSVAQDAGLQIAHERYLYHWTFPVKLGVRLLERTLHSAPTPATVPPMWINTPLYWLSRFEQNVLGHLPIPFGSSLMVVGAKANHRI
jgi:SAM-dependent methyltransferase